MELKIHLFSFIASLLVFIGNLSYFVTRNIREHIEITSLPKHIRRKRKIIILFVYIGYILLIVYNSVGISAGRENDLVTYRSINYSKKEHMLIFLEVSYESILKSIMFLSLVLILPLLEQKSIHTINLMPVLYSAVRLLFYPYIMILFKDYVYLRMFVLEMLCLSETLILQVLFISFVLKIKKKQDKDSYNLIEKYEMEFILVKVLKISKFFIFQLSFEIICRSLLVILMLSAERDLSILMDLVFLFKTNFLSMLLIGISKLVFSKEQPVLDSLISMNQIRYKLENDNIENTKRYKMNGNCKIII